MSDSSTLRATRSVRMAWVAVAGGFGLLGVLIGLPPFVGEGASALLMDVFAPLCHQLPGRSFHVAGEPLAVCHRCTGIYAGLWLGAVGWAVPRIRRISHLPPELLVLAVAPAAIDWTADLAGLWTSSAAVRAGTGAWFGAIAGAYVTGGIIRLLVRIFRRISLSLRPDYSSSR